MFRNKSVNVHQFSMIPRADIPRSSFRRQSTHKTTFDSGFLIPVYLDEVLPGDSFKLHMTAFARLATPLFPIMDNLYLDSFWFFVPNRLVWSNWKKFMGEQANPTDTTSYTIPQNSNYPANGHTVNSIFDYMGLPTAGQITPGSGTAIRHSVLPLRGYNLIWNEWFRDENLQDSVPVTLTDGPESYAAFQLKRRGKRHDYFTSALPWPQKGGVAVKLPLGTSAPVVTAGTGIPTFANTGVPDSSLTMSTGTTNITRTAGAPAATVPLAWATTSLQADLSAATAATINQLRQSFQIQKLLERDARGGTRYTEIVRSHFGVVSPDARLQRPEYLGGGSTPVVISPIAQTSGTGSTGTTQPLGELGAMGTAVSRGSGFRQSFTEHGYIFGLVSVRADLTYQQGMERHWSRQTRFDFYFPAFAMLGEQTILNKEIYMTGNAAQDDAVFGYQERWAEYRHKPSKITGLFRSTSTGTLDPWHLAQKFTALPTLNDQFIQDNPPVNRIVAVPAEGTNQQFLFDAFFDCRVARPLPMYSVPGLIDHF